MKALKGIATIYSDDSLVAGAHDVHPDKLTSDIIDKVVIGKISVGIGFPRGLTLRVGN
jgi:hypothetical protein